MPCTGLGRGKALGVIVRVLRAKVRADRVGAFNAVARRQVALLREQPGLTYVNLARRLKPDGGQEAILFEEWQDAESLYAWVGPVLTEPRLVPGARQLMDELVVAHYECLVDDRAELGLSILDARVPDETAATA
jgi:antibiotic biosynthesis monooxygenase (ABM) superfamily enzyme